MRRVNKYYFLDMRVIEKEKFFLIKSKYGPSNYVKISKELTPDLVCFVGLIFGDGNLGRKKKTVSIELTDRKLIKKIKDLILVLFNKKTKIKIRIDNRKNRKIRFYIHVNNKAIHSLLNRVFEIPVGKKSDIIKIPKIIKNSNIKIKKAFVVGVLASDGGKRQGKLGLSTASKKFRNDFSSLLIEIGIKNNKDQWVYKKYKKEYYGLTFDRISLKVLRECQSGQMGQILNSFLKKIEVHA